MVSEIKFPEVPKIPVSEDFQPYFEATKKPSKFDKILNNVFDFTESEPYKSTGFLSKLVTTIFSIKKNLVPPNATKDVINAAKEANNIASTVGDVLSIISGAGAIASLIRNLKKKHVNKEDKPVRILEMIRSCLQIITTATSFLSILDRFKVIELANITKAMGTIPVIGEGLARVLPVSVVFSGFSILTNTTTIAISAIKLKQTVAKIERINAKSKLWDKPIDGDFAEKKIDRIVTKQKDTVQRATDLKAKIEQMESGLLLKGQNYEEQKEALQNLKNELATATKISRFMRTFKQKNALKVAKMDYRKAVKKYKQASTEMKGIEKAHKIRLEKGEKWESILEKFKSGSITETDSELLEKVRADKQAKWKSKKVNELFAVVKEVTKIALTLIAIAISITMIALVIIYTGNVPAAALISLAVIGLSLTAAQLASKLYFNRIKKRPANSVMIPDFRTLKVGT